MSLSNLTAISEVDFDERTLAIFTVFRFCKVSEIVSIVHCFLEKEGTLKVLMSRIVNNSLFVTLCVNAANEVLSKSAKTKIGVLSIE